MIDPQVAFNKATHEALQALAAFWLTYYEWECECLACARRKPVQE